MSEANGEVERFIKNIEKVVKAVDATKQQWSREVKEYLRDYRATPHSMTGIQHLYTLLSPASFIRKASSISVSNLEWEVALIRVCENWGTHPH